MADAEIDVLLAAVTTEAERRGRQPAVRHYLGHKNIQHAARYIKLSLERFELFG